MTDLTKFPEKTLPDNLQALRRWELEIERKAQEAQDLVDPQRKLLAPPLKPQGKHHAL